MEPGKHLALEARLDVRKSWEREKVVRPNRITLSSTIRSSLETTASTLAVPPEPRTLLIEVSAFPCTPVSNLQHLHNNVIALPAAFP